MTFEVCHSCLEEIPGKSPAVEVEISAPVMNFYGTKFSRQTIRFFGQGDTIELVAFGEKTDGIACSSHEKLVSAIRENPLLPPLPQWVSSDEMSTLKAQLGSSLKTIDGTTHRLKGLYGRPALEITVGNPSSDFQFGHRANSVGVYVSRDADLQGVGETSITLVGSHRFEVVFERFGGMGFEFIKKLD